MSEIRFEAEIKGHQPPYKWKLYRAQAGVSSRSVVTRGQAHVEGEADSFEEAAFEAQAAAAVAYEEWLHENTKENVVVFRGPITVERELKDIPVAEPPRRPALEVEPQLGEHSD